MGRPNLVSRCVKRSTGSPPGCELFPTPFRPINSAKLNYEIAQYSAKSLALLYAKIAQFPKGSRFVITNDTTADEEQGRLKRQS